MNKELISFVIPVFNESSGLKKFHESLSKVIDKNNYRTEIIYVDDGSQDKSAEIIRSISKSDKRIRPIFLAKNFGKELATTAGLHNASGDAVLIIDSDGQHPVELIPKFIEKWHSGFNVVVGIRKTNQKEGPVKRYGSSLFYKSLHLLGVPDVKPGSTDFRLIDRGVCQAFKQLTEHNRITRSLIDWLGFDRSYIYFDAKPREYGEASYSTKKLIKLAVNGFVSLTFTPLYLSGYLGVITMLVSLTLMTFTLINGYIFNDPLSLNVTGTAYLAMLILLLVGLLMVGQGLLALYVARIYTETQNRPLYVLKNDARN